MEDQFLYTKHVEFVVNLDKNQESVEYIASEYLRASGIYWGLSALEVLNCGSSLEKEAIVSFAISCAVKDGKQKGGYGGFPGHDAHLLYTLSCVQLLALCGRLNLVNRDDTISYITSLQKEDGSFSGDQWGEIDTRFTYCALQTLALLGSLHSINIEKSVEYISKCKNFDGGFGSVPGAESHAGQIFCCVGALAIAGGGALERVIGENGGADLLGWWLSERQVDSGGLNGRPEKQSDVCYSWWILSSLSILGRVNWIDQEKLAQFILDCQDPSGGIADRPGNMADVFHTFFGVAGLSLLGKFGGNSNKHRIIDPVYALPLNLVEELNLPRELMKL